MKMKKPDWISDDENKMDEISFFKEMEIKYPELSEELYWWEDDLIHLKMEVFSRYTNQQIKEGNEKELIRCFHFIEERLGKINSALENAIYVSYCETLFTENTKEEMTKIKKLMWKNLKWFYNDYEKYYSKLQKN